MDGASRRRRGSYVTENWPVILSSGRNPIRRTIQTHGGAAKICPLIDRLEIYMATPRLAKNQPDVPVTERLPAEARREIKRRLADAGLTLVHFSACGFDQGSRRA